MIYDVICVCVCVQLVCFWSLVSFFVNYTLLLICLLCQIYTLS